jgi:hypothetical protein
MFAKLRTRRTRSPRVVAAILLGSVLALTCAPICGSPLDVDAGQCCKRQGCAESSASVSDGLSATRATKRGTCCHSSSQGLSATHSDEECCQRGRLTFPTAKIQSSVSAATLTTNALTIFPPATPIFAAVDSSAFALTIQESPPSRIHPIPLYTLNSTYRI